ncbi:MAG: glycosyltransferase family 1 protein [Gemmatimonadales bacterium]|nr:glycosyltransferase family 1 protein [Gemmatimonadales bacterium]
MTLRIGVDATCWSNRRGYGRFARELMLELVALAPEHQFLCIGDASAFASLPLVAPNVERIMVPQDAPPTEAASADGFRSLSDLWRLTRATARLNLDVFFSPSVYTYYPLQPSQRAVVTVHDAIAERFPELTLPSTRARFFWRLKVGLAVRQADLVLTVSDYAAEQVAAAHRLPTARIRVAVEAPASCYYPATPAEVAESQAAVGLPPGAAYFTYVGGFSPHKRLDVILRAHAALAAEGQTVPYLLLIGRLEGDSFLTSRSELLALIAELGTAGQIIWTGYAADATVRALHTGAVASLLVSESEGFGLPAVEAAACGTPVIATTESPLPHLLAGGGIFVAPGDLSALTEAMGRLLQSPVAARALGQIAREGAARLTWRRTAEATLSALQEAAAA